MREKFFFPIKTFRSVVIFLVLLPILQESIQAQLATNAPWPMFRQNNMHTGQTNKNVTGPKKNPVKIWDLLSGGNIDSSPAIGPDGTVYVGSDDGNLYAITNGTVKWSYFVGGRIQNSSPAIGTNGIIYIGSDNGSLYAIKDGIFLWSFPTSGWVTSPVISRDGTIYVGSSDGNLYAITNGILKWYYATGNSIWEASPTIGESNTIYIGSSDGNFYAITNGKMKWSYPTGDVRSAPAISPNGTIYIGSWDNKLFAITNGKLKWSFTTGDDIYGSPAIGPDGTVYIGSLDKNLYAIASNNGAVKWSFPTAGYIMSSPAVDLNNTVYVGSWDNKIYAVTNGALCWSYPTGNIIYWSSPAIGSDGTIYIGCYDQKLYAIKQNYAPELLWTSNPGYLIDGVKPNTNIGGTYFKFEVKYKDFENVKPLTNQLWIDVNDNGFYENTEKFTMYSNSGTSYSNGIVFTNSQLLYYTGDGIINYAFYFKDNYNAVPLPCAQTSNNIVRVTNTKTPTLGWMGVPNYIADGVDPNTNYNGGTNFIFRIRYTNALDIPPNLTQVWIDTNDDGEYSLSEQFNMVALDNSDVIYTDGKEYTFTNLILFAGDGVLNFKFVFNDGISIAMGPPTINQTITIYKSTIYYVKTNGNDSLSGNSWDNAWKTVQKAANTMIAGDRTFISNGNYLEWVNVVNSGSAGNPITFQAFNPGTVTVDANYDSPYVFNIENIDYIQIIGLCLRAGTTYGAHIFQSSYFNIRNCVFRQDNYGAFIAGDSSKWSSYGSISNCLFTNNSYGVYFSDGNQNNGIIKCRFVQNAIGVNFVTTGSVPPWYRSSNGNLVYSNAIYKNSSYGIATGFNQQTGDGNRMINNSIYSNSNDGINFRNSLYTMYSNNFIYGNSGNGICLNNWDKSTSYFFNNTIKNNSSWGIIINLYNNNTLKNNIIYSNASGGVRFGNSANNSAISNNIYGMNQTFGMQIAGINNTIQDNNVHNNQSYGIHINQAQNSLKKNSIYSNNIYGIWIDSTANNRITTNNIYGLNQNNGIFLSDALNNTIYSNNIHHNENIGIRIRGTSIGNSIINNRIFSNNQMGLAIIEASKKSNIICSNIIYGPHQDYGIYITGDERGWVLNNNVYQHATNGMTLYNCTNTLIQYNLVYNNPIGLDYQNANTLIYLNSLTNNLINIVFRSGLFQGFSKNNLSPSFHYCLSNVSGLSRRMTNNWWGDTIASNIQKKIYGQSGYSNFTPYRLYGLFDVSPYADTDPPDKVTTLLSLVSQATVTLTWNRNNSSDFVRYRVYRSLVPGTTNLGQACVISNIYDVSQTNIFDHPPHNGTWYYTVTALDNKECYTNESWYGFMTNGIVFVTTTFSLEKSISNILRISVPSLPVPGSMITYKIIYSNTGNFYGDKVLLTDKLPSNISFFTEGNHTATGWTFEYSTNAVPDQNYSSINYLPGYPANRTLIKWIRWKKNIVAQNEKGFYFVYKVVIK